LFVLLIFVELLTITVYIYVFSKLDIFWLTALQNESKLRGYAYYWQSANIGSLHCSLYEYISNQNISIRQKTIYSFSNALDLLLRSQTSWRFWNHYTMDVIRWSFWGGIWCFTPLSTTFPLYRGGECHVVIKKKVHGRRCITPDASVECQTS
jgi:hypothetical protein